MSTHEPRLSVRAQATVTVPADSVVLGGAVRAAAADKAIALATAARALTALTDGLAALGAVPLNAEHIRAEHIRAEQTRAERTRAALTWSARSTTSEDETGEDETTGRWRTTGRVIATVSVEIVARDFDALPAVEAALAGHASFSVHSTSWQVDDDNPAWRQVRADAIRAAVAKARDYAAALGGTLDTLEHIADAGLLGGRDSTRSDWMSRESATFAVSSPMGGDAAPSLDPVPCELTATIDARFTATGVSLG